MSQSPSENGTVPAKATAVAGPNYGKDVFAGFLVFLIALPLCLGISLASGCPAVAGVLTAIVGSLVCALISNSELTIKGPAAGLIVIVLGAVTEFKSLGFSDHEAYRMMLAVGVTAGVIQILFGLLKTGILGEFFPNSAVHGLLAAIGVIIISKQAHVAMGVMDAKGSPLHLLSEIPRSITRMNPEIALIGGVSLLILFGLPFIKNRWVRRVPAQMMVILVAMAMGSWLELGKEHTYSLAGHNYAIGESFLVSVPGSLLKAITSPNFQALKLQASWKWIAMFALIGSLESLLSAKAIDSLDPQKRKTDMNKDLLAIGVANTIAASIGGLPMISEIVRSKANIDNGARSRLAGVTHGLCLLAFVALLPGLIHQIPMAALAAMLVYTGFRLASPKEFTHVAHIGREQLVIFVSTLIGVLATDLLIGIAIGIVVNLAFHIYHGVPLWTLFSLSFDVEQQQDGPCVIRTQNAVLFSNWIALRSQIIKYGIDMQNNIVVDLSQSHVVDHSVLDKLHSLQTDFISEGLTLEIRGLGAHQAESEHKLSTRRIVLPKIVRLTVLVDIQQEGVVLQKYQDYGGVEARIIPCTIVAVATDPSTSPRRVTCIQIEMLTSGEISQLMLSFLSQNLMVENGSAVTIDKVHVLRVNSSESPNPTRIS